MRWLPIVLLAAAAALPACRGCGDEPAGAPPAAVNALPDTRVTCPVCGLEFDGEEAVATRVHEGTTYHFLLEDHARAFAADPAAYLARDANP